MAELHLYDFDSTLFRSPHQPAIWDGDWWSDPASLMEPCVPDRPGEKWWIMPVVDRARESIADPNVFAVMMTGRKDGKAFRYRVPELLKQQGLDFDAVHLTPKTAKSAKRYKIEQVLQYLQRYPQIKKVQIWDDRKSHLREFEKVLKHFGYRVETHLVTVKSFPVKCGEGHRNLDGIFRKDRFAHLYSGEPRPPKKVKYVGIMLNSRGKAALAKEFGYAHDNVAGDHITLGFKLTPELEALLGTPVRVSVIGYDEDEDGQAVVVALPKSVPFQKKGVPHVTLSHSERVGPKYSNELLERGIGSEILGIPGGREIKSQWLLNGIIDTVPSSFSRKVVRDNPSRGMFKMRRNPIRQRADGRWDVIKPDGTVDLTLSDEMTARRLAAACGYDAAPSAPAPRKSAAPRSKQKKAAAKATTGRKAAGPPGSAKPIPAKYRALIPILNEHLRHSARQTGGATSIRGIDEKRDYIRFVSGPTRRMPNGAPEFVLWKKNGDVYRSDYNGRPRKNWNFGFYEEIIARGRTLRPREDEYGHYDDLRGAKSNPPYRGGAISPLIQQMTDIDLCKAWNSTLDLDFDERREGRHFTYENEIEELEREIDYRADGEDMDDWCTAILRTKSNPYRPKRRRR